MAFREIGLKPMFHHGRGLSVALLLEGSYRSNTVTMAPLLAMYAAASIPAGPPPMTPTLRPFIGSAILVSSCGRKPAQASTEPETSRIQST